MIIVRKIEIINELKQFPIGDIPSNNEELLSKAEIVSYLARYQEQFEQIEDINLREELVRNFYTKLLNSELPSITEACKIMGVRQEFLSDYDKLQMLKDSNERYNNTFVSLASLMELEKSKKM